MPVTILTGMRVLVVDDNEDSLEVTALTLIVAGASAQMARSVSEAIALLAISVPDAIVSDLSMPGEDGYSLCRRLRALPPPASLLPAIALSGFASESDRQAAREAGFTIHLAKPVEPAHLVSTVATLIESARADASDSEAPTLPPATIRTNLPPASAGHSSGSLLRAELGIYGTR